jgi:hypothetical protein
MSCPGITKPEVEVAEVRVFEAAKGAGGVDTKAESNNKLDKCLRGLYSKVDDQVHARAVCFGS